jgi:hypothetical protein
MLGYRPELYKQVKEETEKEIAKVKAAEARKVT